MDIVEASKLLLLASEETARRYKNVYVGTGFSNTTGAFFYVRNTETGREEFGLEPHIASIMSAVKRIQEPKFVQITKACVDIIGEEVWLDKEIPFRVKSILSKTVLTDTEDDEYDIERLWIQS